MRVHRAPLSAQLRVQQTRTEQGKQQGRREEQCCIVTLSLEAHSSTSDLSVKARETDGRRRAEQQGKSPSTAQLEHIHQDTLDTQHHGQQIYLSRQEQGSVRASLAPVAVAG